MVAWRGEMLAVPSDVRGLLDARAASSALVVSVVRHVRGRCSRVPPFDARSVGVRCSACAPYVLQECCS